MILICTSDTWRLSERTSLILYSRFFVCHNFTRFFFLFFFSSLSIVVLFFWRKIASLYRPSTLLRAEIALQTLSSAKGARVFLTQNTESCLTLAENLRPKQLNQNECLLRGFCNARRWCPNKECEIPILTEKIERIRKIRINNLEIAKRSFRNNKWK